MTQITSIHKLIANTKISIINDLVTTIIITNNLLIINNLIHNLVRITIKELLMINNLVNTNQQITINDQVTIVFNRLILIKDLIIIILNDPVLNQIILPRYLMMITNFRGN